MKVLVLGAGGLLGTTLIPAFGAMGHTVETPEDAAGGRRSSDSWGNLQTVEWDTKTNTLHTGSDPRNPVGLGKTVEAGKKTKVKP